MPLALLLHDRLGVITTGMGRIAPFGSLMDRATLVLRRRQGAFLHAWFGPGLPIDGLDLRVTVANAPELQARVRSIRGIQDRYRRWEQGTNLLESAAGLAGVLAGLLIGGLVGAVVSGTVLLGLLRLQFRFFGQVFRSIGGGWSLWSRWRALQGEVGQESGNVGDWYTGGRSGAQWAEAGIALGETALGPRPTRPSTPAEAAMNLLDRVAALVAQVLGAAATFLHLVPVIRVLAGAVGPLLGLVEVGKTLVLRAVEDLIDAVTRTIRESGIVHLPGLVLRGLRAAGARIVAFLTGGLDAVRTPFTALADGLASSWSSTAGPVLRAITEHPVVTLLRGMGGAVAYFSRLGSALAALFPRIGHNILPTSVDLVAGAVQALIDKLGSDSSEPGLGARAWRWIVNQVTGGARPPFPSIPAPPPLVTPVVAPVIADIAREEMASLPMYVVGSVPRVFPAEAARLDARIEAVRADPTYGAANLVLQAAARVAGPRIDAEVTSLAARLDELEVTLRRRPRPDTPVRDVPPPRRLVPVLRRVRVTGTDDRPRGDVRSWVDGVIARLAAEPFAVPAAASGAR